MGMGLNAAKAKLQQDIQKALNDAFKEAYKATFKTGVTTDTLDIWGEVTGTCEKAVAFEEVLKASDGFKGEIMQLPPMYSALKKDGVRLYELARQGIEVEREKRKCEIYELTVEKSENGEYSLYCECSAGTYIRTLINDIGEALGCGAVMTDLRRTKANGFDISQAVTVEELAEKAGISIATITKMGKDGAVVSSEVLVKICTALGCTVDDIMEIVAEKIK